MEQFILDSELQEITEDKNTPVTKYKLMAIDLRECRAKVSSARSEGYNRCAEDVKEITVKMITEGVQRGYSEGYVKALDDFIDKANGNGNVTIDSWIYEIVDQLKSAYLGGTDGKQN
jgi:hypothetical protein